MYLFILLNMEVRTTVHSKNTIKRKNRKSKINAYDLSSTQIFYSDIDFIGIKQI